MNTHRTVLNDASAEPTTPDRILQTALAAWREENFVAATNISVDATQTTHISIVINLGAEVHEKSAVKLRDF